MQAGSPNKKSHSKNTWTFTHFVRNWLTAYGQRNARRQMGGLTKIEFGFQGQRTPSLMTIAEKISVQIADITTGVAWLCAQGLTNGQKLQNKTGSVQRSNAHRKFSWEKRPTAQRALTRDNASASMLDS